MVLIGLGCCLALAAGIKLGLLAAQAADPTEARPEFAFTLRTAGRSSTSRAFSSRARCSALAPDYPSFRQIIATSTPARLGILFLILRRLCAPPSRWGLMARWSASRVVLGITGFFAGFREPIVLGRAGGARSLRPPQHAPLGGGRRRRRRSPSALGLLWMGIRGDYRSEYVEIDKFAASRSARVERVGDLTSAFFGGSATDICGRPPTRWSTGCGPSITRRSRSRACRRRCRTPTARSSVRR